MRKKDQEKHDKEQAESHLKQNLSFGDPKAIQAKKKIEKINKKEWKK